MAGKWAQKNSFDEALILNPDKSLSETNTANILIIRDNKVIRPSSPHALRGVMEKNICKFLLDNGYTEKSKTVMMDDLISSDKVIMTNSLIGAVQVLSINSLKFENSESICNKINDSLL